MIDQDCLQKFIFQKSDIRGELVHLDSCYQSALERTDYPLEIRGLLGEAMVASILLSATIKFSGKITFQLRGGGILKTLLVQATHDRKIRGMADWEGDVSGLSLLELAGNAQCVITIESNKGKRYQGIVPMDGESLSKCLENYFCQSEQLETRIWLYANDQKAGGLLLQRMPKSEHDEGKNAWEHLTILTDTISATELLSLPNEELLYRLYHDEEVRLFKREEISFHCPCSQERCEGAVLSLGAIEIEKIIQEQQEVNMTCEFCNSSYSLDLVDLTRLHKEAKESFVHS